MFTSDENTGDREEDWPSLGEDDLPVVQGHLVVVGRQGDRKQKKNGRQNYPILDTRISVLRSPS